MPEKALTLYHGSQQIVQSPTYGLGNPHNDYGLGFYCTQSIELAKEWGASRELGGYANKYRFDTDGLSILNLNNGSYTILHWLAVLLENRIFRVSGDIAPLAREFILERFKVPYHKTDVMVGYRADDSYFSFAQAFLNNALSLSRLEQAMHLGNLGEQIVIKSKKAFERLTFEGAEHAEQSVYYAKRMERDEEARRIYQQEIKLQDLTNDITILGIMQEDWKANDARLRRKLS